jgi:signal transduction histidine kinase
MPPSPQSEPNSHLNVEVVSVISHQFKTPLSGIKACLEVLLAEEIGALSERQRDYLREAQLKTIRTISLVEQLLDVSRVEQGRLEFHPETFNLADLAQNVIDDLALLARAKNATISIEADTALPNVFADSKKIREVISNILTNAIRYVQGKGVVAVRVFSSDGHIAFSCRDNGIGIDPEEREKIFTKFYRGKRAASLETSGTGVGLYIAKSIIEKSGGRMWFESAVGEGTTFYFTLPSAPAAQ